MALTIISNEQAFIPKSNGTKYRHLGTRDRYNKSIQFDYPGKAMGCLDAARMLQNRTLPEPISAPLGRLVDGQGKPLAPIKLASTTRMPTLADLEVGHDAQYLKKLAECVLQSQARAAAGEDPYISDFGTEADVTPGTLDAARLAVGAAFDALDLLLSSSQQDTAFGLVWPPGHHAERDLAMGFCYLSNIALAALYARDHSSRLRPGHNNRVVVIDIDHHRGNGTAHVLASQPDTLMIDISYRSPYDHIRKRFTDGRYDSEHDRYRQTAKEYPYSHPDTDWGFKAHPMVRADNVLSFEFEGEQTPDAIMGRFVDQVLPTIKDFAPDVVLWSLGLDSAMGDPIGGLGYLPSSFYTMIRGLRIAFPSARHGGLLEGGYDEQRWFTCLPPALLALHEDPHDALNRCKVFSRYRPAFEKGSGAILAL
jgi:acetoin utilization deacetylase AcuC-like enzyme